MSNLITQTSAGLACMLFVCGWQASCSREESQSASTTQTITERPRGTEKRKHPARSFSNEIASTTTDSELEAIFDQWLRADRESCLRWIKSAPRNPRLTSRYARIILKTLPAEDHSARSKWAENFPADIPLMTETAAARARVSPADTCDWLLNLENRPGVIEAVSLVTRRWVRENPEAASLYLTALPPGAKKDAAIAALSAAISREDPEAAAIWSETIENPVTRSRVAKALNALTSSLPARHDLP